MDRLTQRLFLGAIVVVIAVAGVVAFVSRPDSQARPTGPTVDGVVVQVDSSGLSSVRGFTLRTADGRLLEFGLAELRNAVQFAPGHLAEHVATSTPIRVWYREASGTLQALWLEDAPAAASTAGQASGPRLSAFHQFVTG